MKNLLITIITILVLVGCGGADERKAAYMEKAMSSMEKGDYEKARIELKNVLQIDPKHAKAYFVLGQVYEKTKEYRKAFANFSKAEEIDGTNLEYMAKLGMYYALSSDLERAREKMDFILSKDAENLEGLILKIGILLKERKTEEARQISQAIYQETPEHVENALTLSLLYAGDKEYDKAIEILDTCITHNKKDKLLTNALAKLLLVSGNHDRAEIEYKKLLSDYPEDFSNYVKLAQFYQRIGKGNEAEAVLRNAVDEDNEDLKRKVALVTFVKQRDGNKAAIDELKRLITDNPDIGRLRIILGNLYIAEDDKDSAEEVYKTTINKFSEMSEGIKSRIALANLYMSEKNIESASSIIDEALTIEPNNSMVNMLKAKLSMLNEDKQQAIISARIAVKEDPENVDAYFILAAAHKLNNEKEQANDVISRAYESNRLNVKALLALSQYHVRNREIDRAEDIIDNCLNMAPDNYDALTIKSGILIGRKQFDKAKTYIDRMLLTYPGKRSGYMHSAISLSVAGNTDEALVILNDGYKKTGGDRMILKTLVSSSLALKKYNDITVMVENEIKSNADDVELYMLLSGVYVASGRLDDAEKTLKDSFSIDSSIDGPYIALSSIYLKTNKYDKAIAILKDGLLKTNDDLQIAFTLASVYESHKDYDSAINKYEDILKTYPDNAVSVNNLASLLSEFRTDEASKSRANELADKLKDVKQPAMLDTVGWVYYKDGRYADAVTVLKSVVEKSPDVSVFNYHLGMAYLKSGDKTSAGTFLSKALSTDVEFQGRKEASAQLKQLK